MTRKAIKPSGYTLTEIVIAIALIVFFAAVVFYLVPQGHVYNHTGNPPAKACVSNLRIIDGAKGQWALELHKQNTDTPTARDIQPYMGRGPEGELPVCPSDSKQTFDTSYSANNMATKPTCKIYPATHSLQ